MQESDAEYDSEQDSDVDMCMEDDVDALCSIDLDGNVDMQREGDDKKEEDEEEEHGEEEEDEDEDEDDGKEPQKIGQGEMVNTSADKVDIMVHYQPIVLAEQGQEMREHTLKLQPLVPAPLPQSSEPRPPLRTPETHPLSELECSGLATLYKPHPAAPTLREAKSVGNISDVDVDQQLLG